MDAASHSRKIHNLDCKKNNEGKTVAPLLQKYTTNKDSSKNLREATSKSTLDVPSIKDTIGGYRSNIPSVNEIDKKRENVVSPLMYSKKDLDRDGQTGTLGRDRQSKEGSQEYVAMYSPNHDPGLYVTYPRYIPDHCIVGRPNHARSVSPCLQTFRPASNAHLYENALNTQSVLYENAVNGQAARDMRESKRETEHKKPIVRVPYNPATRDTQEVNTPQQYVRENMQNRERHTVLRPMRQANQRMGRSQHDLKAVPRSTPGQGQTSLDQDGLERLCDELVQGLQDFSGSYDGH